MQLGQASSRLLWNRPMEFLKNYSSNGPAVNADRRNTAKEDDRLADVQDKRSERVEMAITSGMCLLFING